MMEAILYQKGDQDGVVCRLCAHGCHIPNGKRGLCAVRENRGGTLYTLVYGKLIAEHVDPIEKKPLFHFLPGSVSYSIAAVGCNFRCRFCQNADIAQMPNDRNGVILGEERSVKDVVNAAMASGSRSISYTYTEPTVFGEFALDVMTEARRNGLKNVFVTNGYMSGDALDAFAPVLDAANVDLKAFSEDFYHKICSAKLAPVLETLRRMVEYGIWVEVTTLIIPGLNDDPKELEQLAAFLRTELGSDVPWHISRFHPDYRMLDRSATPVSTLKEARRIGLAAGLHYVYTGNVPGDSGEHTYCPGCSALLIERMGFWIRKNRIANGKCPECNASIAIRET
uniref:AmmeMemoRadiSam system radical SAM enzyme n=1 Tax=Desulfatirhabdium butyrativorans TaxID=340467 RepID=A0A7C4RHF6_9BACT